MNAKGLLGVALLGAGAAALWLTTRLAETREGESMPAAPLQPAALSAPRPSQTEIPLLRPERERRSAIESPVKPAAEPAQPPSTAATRLLRGRVLDAEARPLAGIEVSTGAEGGEFVAATSGRNGTFELQLPRGRAELRATDPALVTVMSGRVDETSAVEPLVVVAPRIELAGVVLDESGAPLSQVHVRLDPPRGFRTRFEAVFDTTASAQWKTQCDERGRFELAPVPYLAGAQLLVELEGFEPWRGEVPWGGDRNLVLTLIRSTASVPVVAGRVVDAAQRAVAGAWVSLGSRSTATDVAGEFRLEREDALDSFELRALKSGYRIAELRAAKDASGAPVWPSYVVLELGAPPLSLDGRVVDAGGEPRPGMLLWIADPTPFGILQDDMEASAEFFLGDPEHGDAYWHSLETDAEGSFRIDGLLERAYSISVMNPRTLETLSAGPFQAGGEPARIVFADGALGRIAGRVVTRDGGGLPGVTLTIRANSFGGVWMDAGSTQSDAEGRFAFEDVRNETLMISAEGDDVVPHWFPVAAQRGAETVLELAVAVRCTLQVDLGTATERADALRVLDGEGEELLLHRIGPGGSYRANEFPLVEGRSESLGVSDSARTLVLLKGGAEVLRVPLGLRAGTLNRITP